MRLTICALCLALASCVTQSIPTHGGGKRFFYEQALVTMATDDALSQLDLSAVVAPVDDGGAERPPVCNVYVVAMGDEGGGVDSGGTLMSKIGLGTVQTQGNSAQGATYNGNGQGYGGGTESASHAFANARDIEYVRARVIELVLSAGARIGGDGEANVDRDVYIVVGQFGTAKSGFDLLIYTEGALAARTVVDGFCFDRPGKGEAYMDANGKLIDPKSASAEVKSLGRGACTAEYLAQYVFGFGPIGGAEISLTPGELPVRFKRNEPRELIEGGEMR